AELRLVVVELALGSLLVFDRPSFDDARAGRIAADLDEIGLAGKAKSVGIERQRSEELPTSSGFEAGLIDVFMGEISQKSVLVVHEDALGVDEIGTPRAV